jgi:ADP-ribosylglycohydrolase
VRLSDGSTVKGDQQSMGYFGVALQAAFYYLLHTTSFSSGLENVIALGGDTDTNGCIAGSLLGARFGADGIPDEWIESVKRAEPCTGGFSGYSVADAEELVEQLAKLS